MTIIGWSSVIKKSYIFHCSNLAVCVFFVTLNSVYDSMSITLCYELSPWSSRWNPFFFFNIFVGEDNCIFLQNFKLLKKFPSLCISFSTIFGMRYALILRLVNLMIVKFTWFVQRYCKWVLKQEFLMWGPQTTNNSKLGWEK